MTLLKTEIACLYLKSAFVLLLLGQTLTVIFSPSDFHANSSPAISGDHGNWLVVGFS